MLDRFEAQAARTPGNAAVVCAQGALTYGELNARANVLAHELTRRGAGPSDMGGILLPNGCDYATAMLAVLKARGTFVPLDPDAPPLRFAKAIARVHPRYVITGAAQALACAARLEGLEVLAWDFDRHEPIPAICRTAPIRPRLPT